MRSYKEKGRVTSDKGSVKHFEVKNVASAFELMSGKLNSLTV